MKHTKESLELTQNISNEINTFHHHYYILLDIANSYHPQQNITYVEIGCYAGASACLMLQRPNTRVVSIDLGESISPKEVEKNVAKLNKHNNPFDYIKGNSKDLKTVNLLNKLVSEIDILFIDGGHRYQEVIDDFNLYSKNVKKGGYIVFDDYNDKKYCPEVKPAVDDLLKTIGTEYLTIGTIKNIFNAKPTELQEGNCFIIKKI